MHINVSAVSADGRDVMPAVIAGMLEHAYDMTAFLNPTDESYLRFGSHKAPGYISWSVENRSQLIRIPAADSRYKRAELRSPDPACNPYLAFALVIRAGLDGINTGAALPKECAMNLFTASDDVTEKLRRLPQSLAEAKNAAAHSAFIASALPEGIIDNYTK